MAVSNQPANQSVHSLLDMRAPDGTSLVAHLWIIRGLLALPGDSCAQKELVHSVRCVADVLLQTTALLLQVRARDAGLTIAAALDGTLLRSLGQAAIESTHC